MTLSPLLVAAATLAGVFAVLVLREPLKVGLSAFAVTIPFGQMFSIGSSAFTSLSSMVGLLMAGGLVLQRLRQRPADVEISATVPIWLLFVGLVGATAFWSVSSHATEIGFLIILSLVGIFVLVSLSEVDTSVLRWVENGILIGGLLAALYAFYQFIFQGGFPTDPPSLGPQAGGRFGNGLLGPNNQAVSFLLPLFIALSRLVLRERVSQRVLHGLLAVLFLFGVLFTASRGGLLAVVVGLVVLIVALPRGRKPLLVFGGLSLAMAAFIFFTQPAGIAERTVATTSSSGRTDIWRVAFAACSQYCAVGSGWETFPDVYAATQATVPEARVLVGQGMYQAHDVWILVAIELGVPGLILLIAALACSLRDALRLPRQLRAPPLAGLVGTLFAGFFLSNLEYKFFWLALIYVALTRNLAQRLQRAAFPATAAGQPMVAHGAGGAPDHSP